MCSGHARIRRLAQVNSHTLIVFIAPKVLCDYDKLLHQNVRQYAVFPAHVPASIPLRATVVLNVLLHLKHESHHGCGCFHGNNLLNSSGRC